jgi:hypothetical protein
VPAKSREEHLHETTEIIEQGPSYKASILDSLTPATSQLKVSFTEEPFTDSRPVIFYQLVDSSNRTAPNE